MHFENRGLELEIKRAQVYRRTISFSQNYNSLNIQCSSITSDRKDRANFSFRCNVALKKKKKKKKKRRTRSKIEIISTASFLGELRSFLSPRFYVSPRFSISMHLWTFRDNSVKSTRDGSEDGWSISLFGDVSRERTISNSSIYYRLVEFANSRQTISGAPSVCTGSVPRLRLLG